MREVPFDLMYGVICVHTVPGNGGVLAWKNVGPNKQGGPAFRSPNGNGLANGYA